MPNLYKNRQGSKLASAITSALLWLLFVCPTGRLHGFDDLTEFQENVRPIVAKYCFKCHSDGDPNGNIDLKSPQSNDEIDSAYESWRNAVRALSEKRMPPEKEPAPSDAELATVARWYKARFVDNVIARPGPFRPRRLSAREYRNTLRSLFGFDLRANVAIAEDTVAETSLVMKLLPTDPPGPSRYRNDTYSNSLTPLAWDSYSQLADSAIDELFSTAQKANLESLAGKIQDDGFALANAERLLRNIQPRALRRTLNEETLRSTIDRVKMSARYSRCDTFRIKSAVDVTRLPYTAAS